MNPSDERLAWADYTYVVIWTFVIYVTIPFAVPVLRFLGSNFGGDKNIGRAVAAILFLILAAVTVKLLRRPGFNGRRALWFFGVLAVYAYFMKTIEVPAEKIHFIEFGILAILLFRALRHRIPNRLVHLAVLPLGVMVGLSDEYVQTLVPMRVGEIEDVMKWDLSAIILALIALANAWAPEGLDRPLRREHVWGTFWIWAAAVLACGIFMMRFTDFGHRLEDPAIGAFNSAFTRPFLARVDASRGAEAAGFVDSDTPPYAEFLRKFSSKTDPYVHEARVHIFSRDKNLSRVRTAEVSDTQEVLLCLNKAAMENRILELYFPTLMSHTTRHAWGDTKTEIEGRLAAADALIPNHQSLVGKNMLTWCDRKTFWLALLGIILLMALAAFTADRRLSA